MHPIESLRVGDDETELGVFAVPEMSLSSAREGMRPHSFVMTIRPAALVDFLTPEYEKWVEASREDDQICGGPQDELAVAGYPSLDKILSNPNLLTRILGSYLLHEFVGSLTWDGTSPIKYWLDEVVECQFDGEAVNLSGICYSKLR